jgi:hypothetical protein
MTMIRFGALIAIRAIRCSTCVPFTPSTVAISAKLPTVTYRRQSVSYLVTTPQAVESFRVLTRR